MAGRHRAQKGVLTNPFRRGHRRLTVVGLAVAALALLATAHPTPTTAAIGVPLVLAGGLLRTWAAGHLLKTRELTISGPYAYTRNPLYVGTFLIGAGFVAIAGSLVAMVAAPIGLILFFASYFPRKEKSESELLEKIYGEPYRAYHAAVPPLLPRLTAWTPGDGTPPRRWSFERMRNNGETGTELTVVIALLVLAAQGHWRPVEKLRALGRTPPAVVGQLAPALEQPEELLIG